jgi:hypothetical protein
MPQAWMAPRSGIGIDTTKGEVPCHYAIRNTQYAIRNTQSAIRNPQSAIRNPLSICALLAALLLCSVATQAQEQELPNDEGPYLEGVFARDAGPPLILPARLPEYEPAPLFDEKGNSNSVIVLLDFDDHTIFPESQLGAMAAQGYELGRRLDRLRLSQHQRQCAGDPVN